MLFGLCTVTSTCVTTATTTAVERCAAVTLDWRASIIVSSSMLSVVDRRLLYITSASQMFATRRCQSPSAVLVVLLLLRAGVESNPGPAASAQTPLKNIRLGLLNTRSAVHKAAVIHDIIRDNSLDVIVLTETWVREDAPNAVKMDVAPPGYTVCHLARRQSAGKTRGGGIAVICRNTLKVTSSSDFSSAEFESLAVRVVTRSTAITIVGVYRPPGSVTTAFCDAVSDLFDQLLMSNKTFVMCGDFNVPGADGSSIDPQMENLLTRYNFVQHVHQATHIGRQDHPGNLLDLVITADTDSHLVTRTTVTQTCLNTDHFLVHCNLRLTAESPSVVSYSYRDVKNINLDTFRADLAESKLFQCSDDLDADTYAELMSHELRLLMDQHAPIRRKVKRCGKNDCRWLSPEARKAKQRRRRLERRYRRTGKSSDRQAYKAAAVAAHDSIMKSRADSFRERLAEAGSDQRAIWRVSNQLLHSRPPTYYSDDDCARLSSSFGQFFADKLKRIGETIASNVTASTTAFATRPYGGPSLNSLSPVTTADVHRLLAKMPAKSSPLDILPTSLLKACADQFAVIVARLANASFREGRFPACFKTAEVLPLLKKTDADRTNPANFRPISNLSSISKVLERLALAQLRPHLLSSDNFCPFQSGYRTGHSTETALLELLNDVFIAGDDRRCTVVIGLDISAAFDTISHQTLLDRLQAEFGLCCTALDWIRSYLLDRKQYVKIGQHSSGLFDCRSGVPQGSVLGPLLFAAYVSPVGSVIESFGVRHQQYADDTQLYLSMRPNDPAHGLDVLRSCSTAVRDWYLTNDLLLNADKSQAIVLGTANQLRSASSIDSVEVAGAVLSVETTLKLLGVTFDQRLTFNDYAAAIVKSCNYHARAIRHVRHLLTKTVACTLACSLINSRLDYCNSLLYGAPASTIDKLQRAQNNAARAVLCESGRSDARPLLRQLHWLPVRQRITYKTAVLARRASTTGVPAYLKEHLVPRPATRYTDFARRSFSYAAPVTWNSLPANITLCDSEHGFKRQLKTFLFRQSA